MLVAVLVTDCAARDRAVAPPPPPVFAHINLTEDWPYPFSSAVRVGDTLYLSGQIGTRIESGAPKLVPGGIEAETRQALENIRAGGA